MTQQDELGGGATANGEPPCYLTVGEVAAQLRVSTMTVYRLINSGAIPAVRVGRSFRLRPEDLEFYLARNLTRAV